MSVVKIMAAALQDELQQHGLNLSLVEYERIMVSVIERVSRIAYRDTPIGGSNRDRPRK